MARHVGGVGPSGNARIIMAMVFNKVGGTDVIHIERTGFSDERGSFTRLYCEEEFASAGLPTNFPHINFSENTEAYTMRGMHLQLPPHGEGKLVFCAVGRIFDVAVDVRPQSSTFGRWVGAELTADRKNSLYLPPGFAHGFLTLEPNSKVIYLATHPYHASAERGFRYDDPSLGIDWPAKPIIVSEKDRAWPDFDSDAFKEDGKEDK
jgi:dTDP-4-dehydrorhamnose 3,5-epimerase